MTEVRLGVLQPGAIKYSDENTNPTFRGFARDKSNDQLVPVFAKIISYQKVFIECVCTVIGKRVGIPMPNPYILKVDKKSKLVIDGKSIETIAFGSEDAKFPSLRRKILDKSVLDKFCKTQLSIAVGVFDEWIINEDRNIGNILYGGAKTFLFIDHESSGILSKSPSEQLNENYVLELISQKLSDKQKLIARGKAKEDCAAIATKKIDDIKSVTYGSSYVNEEDITASMKFLAERVTHLDKLIEAKIPSTQTELSL